jgi:hypothetical protein
VTDQDSPNDSSAPPDPASFEDLVAVIDEELNAQIAIGRLGAIDPAAHAIHQVASLIADEVYRAYQLMPRARPDHV